MLFPSDLSLQDEVHAVFFSFSPREGVGVRVVFAVPPGS
jgi:hypothetical protein